MNAVAGFARLEDLFGCRIGEMTERHLAEAVARAATQPLREDADLDFKQAAYAKAEDLGADVTAMANTRGGLIVVGVSESDGVAAGLTPVEISDEGERKMRQMLADTVFPRIDYEVMRVPTAADSSRGFFLLIIRRSPLRPHACRSGTALRYYLRDGPRNRPLAESEVADLYRNRFEASQGQIDRLRQIHASAVDRHPDLAEWITVALVPTTSGFMPIQGRTVSEMRRWARRYAGGHLGDGPLHPVINVSVGFGFLDIESHGLYSQCGRAELRTDGSGFAAVDCRQEGNENCLCLDDENCTLAVFGMLKFLADHALNTGGHGDALVIATAGAPEQRHAFQLGHCRRGESWEEYGGTRTLERLPFSEHTVDLEAIATNNRERALAVRMLLSDWLHAFGFAEFLQINEEGALRTPYWHLDALRGWSGRVGLEEDPREVWDG